MSKIIGLIILVALGIGVFALYERKDPSSPETSSEASRSVASQRATETKGDAKEFETTAYYDNTGVWYSLKEMRVKKGDRVRVIATNTKGMHDFVIDEFGVKQELPLNQKVSIEFVADKTGEFVFYCSKPEHRAKGQWGKLIVE